MGGMISAYKKLQTRSGQFMAFVTVEDLYGSVECVCFPKVYDKVKAFLVPDKVVSISGKISINDDKAPSIIVDKMIEFTVNGAVAVEEEKEVASTGNKEKVTAVQNAKAEETPVVSDKPKTLWLNISGLEQEDVDELVETLSYYAGDTQVIFVQNGKKLRCSQGVTANRALLAELSGFLEEKCIKLI